MANIIVISVIISVLSYYITNILLSNVINLDIILVQKYSSFYHFFFIILIQITYTHKYKAYIYISKIKHCIPDINIFYTNVTKILYRKSGKTNSITYNILISSRPILLDATSTVITFTSTC